MGEFCGATPQLKILLTHNYYSSTIPSGENEVVRAEIALLKNAGDQVDEYYRSNDEIKHRGLRGKLTAAFSTPWNPLSARDLLSKVHNFGPDVVHVHNTFPLVSPSIFHAIGKRAARVLTLHNYRLFCPAAIPMRYGSVCTECLDRRSALPSIVHGCYRESRIATIPLAISVGLHRMIGTWTKRVDAFICLTEFQRQVMVSAGLPAEKVHVKPNFYPGNPTVVPWAKRQPYVVFVGRLTAEKGVINLMRAWQAWGAEAPELRLVGSGELRPELERMAEGLPVRFLGQLSAEHAQTEIANARLQILPSEWFEGFPMVVREAFAFGTPAAVSNIGPLPSIVEHGKSGIVFQPANPQSLRHEVRTAWVAQGLLERLGQGARAEFEGKYTEEANYATLIQIYRKAIDASRSAAA